ncbi:BRO-N domain-containing protein [Mameliella alba]|uniref:Prophage antirepressor n=1 Tax=Mameliella alba TaxID=561184 RepID=A0A0B3RU59_9RHOB|nr:BRO family protein [Mameliella alba]KHQ50298.1 Prophage antirepressor [Mameliella alba]
MSAEIIPFDFDEQAVRVVMRGDDPWFVAADVCRVLDIGNSRDATARLDDDERLTVGNPDGQTGRGGARQLTIISESGLYALVLTSRKPEARRFRKWITAEVLPSLRRSGTYQVPTADAGIDADTDAGTVAGMPMQEAALWLQMVREARLTRGTRAATSVWDRSPLPALAQLAPARAEARVQDGHGCLAHLLALEGETIEAARAHQLEVAWLSSLGLRVYPEALFVANGSLPAFDGTEWSGGLHRPALLSLPGVHPAPTVRSLNGAARRGLLLPWRLVDGDLA